MEHNLQTFVCYFLANQTKAELRRIRIPGELLPPLSNEPTLPTSLLSTSLLSLPLPLPISSSIRTGTSPVFSEPIRRFSRDSASDSGDLAQPTWPRWSWSISAEVSALDTRTTTRERVWTDDSKGESLLFSEKKRERVGQIGVCPRNSAKMEKGTRTQPSAWDIGNFVKWKSIQLKNPVGWGVRVRSYFVEDINN